MERYIQIKKSMAYVASALAIMLLAGTLWGMKAQAAASYRVTFRTGEVGVFANTGALAARYLADYPAEILAVRVLSDRAVELEVKAGSAIPAAPQVSDFTVSEGYALRAAEEWGPEAGGIVDVNKDYVADYKPIVTGTYYTIRLVDEAQGTDIVPPVTIKGDIGDVISYTAPAKQKNSMYHPYVLSSVATQTITLSAAGDNLLEFQYKNTYDPGFYVTGEIEYADQDYIIIEEDGGTAYVNGAQAIKEQIPQTVIVENKQAATGPIMTRQGSLSKTANVGNTSSKSNKGNEKTSPKTGDESRDTAEIEEKAPVRVIATEIEMGRKNEMALVRAVFLLAALAILGAVIMLVKSIKTGNGFQRR